MIAVGVKAQALSSYMGRATIAITRDGYGRFMTGKKGEPGRQLDAYLDRADGQTRIAQVAAL
jgi:hypothetical protein